MSHIARKTPPGLRIICVQILKENGLYTQHYCVKTTQVLTLKIVRCNLGMYSYFLVCAVFD